jgi:signal transduction histidine kinase
MSASVGVERLQQEPLLILPPFRSHLSRDMRNRSIRVPDRYRLVDDVSKLAWATNPRHNKLERLAAYLREHASDFLETAGLDCQFEFPKTFTRSPVSGEIRRHLFLGVKEALNNIVKDAHATEVVVRLSVTAQHIYFTVSDNGCGFDSDPLSSDAPTAPQAAGGNGLRNLTERLVRGEACIQSTPGQGTTVDLRVPSNATGIR